MFSCIFNTFVCKEAILYFAMMEKKYNRVKEVLKAKDKTQYWLAKQIDISPHALNKICNNKSQPRLVTLYKIAAALEVPVSDLLMEENPEEND